MSLQPTPSPHGGTPNVDSQAESPFQARALPENLAKEYGAVALGTDGDALLVAFTSAPSEIALRRIERATGLRVRVTEHPEERVTEELARTVGSRLGARFRPAETDAPAVRFVERLQERALRERCSDIHLEPEAQGLRVRFRVDGVLREVERCEAILGAAIISRVKVLAGMDIAEKRVPQDGRYTVRIAEHVLDARVSSVPTQDGEKLVIRFLNHHTRLPSLDSLGMDEVIQARFTRVIDSASGFIVVCGPTGSGKTTTLYAALERLNTSSRNICTVEDPVEQEIACVTQVQVNARAGVSFDRVLRALLRQDPDVIMVGEMRDSETASIAVAAALSGQLVLTTLHSTDAPRAVDRLIELGISRASLAAGLSAILSQRLVRKRCLRCVRTIAGAFESPGCEHCLGLGYHERIGIFELIVVDDDISEAIVRGASSVELGRLAATSGYRSMRHDALAKAEIGLTGPEELIRTLGSASS
ncbi:MAG TPA: GspE/PulE family protein [Candidatus Baltobacteraceae bacterium]|jgi:general secretion pathway protein E|nr:GspE/PulE family protein [Candidatus Baltobacteraceae bacterium]